MGVVKNEVLTHLWEIVESFSTPMKYLSVEAKLAEDWKSNEEYLFEQNFLRALSIAWLFGDVKRTFLKYCIVVFACS